MRKRLLIALAAVVAVAAVLAGVAVHLRDEAERNWRLAMEELERQLGPEAKVTYGSLEIALFGQGGRVQGLEIAAPDLPEPFELAVAELTVRGLDDQRLAFETGTAAGLVFKSEQGRWRVDRLELHDVAYDGPLLGGAVEQLQRLSFSSGSAEQILFDRPTDLGKGLVAELTRLELGPVASGRAERVRFERLALDRDVSQHGEVARGAVEGLALPQLAELLAGRLSPGEPLAEHTRIEDFLLRDDELEVRFASMAAQERISEDGLHQDLTVEGLTWEGSGILLASFWAPIQEAGFEPALRLHAETVVSAKDGRLRIAPLVLELPEAASLELFLDLLGFDGRAAVAGPETMETGTGEARLVSARLTLVNRGGLDVMLAGPAGDQGMTAQQLRQVAAFQVVEGMREGSVPRELGLALQEFLADPGRLEIRVEPAEPAPLGQFALLVVAPQLAAEQLGVSAQATPPDSE